MKRLEARKAELREKLERPEGEDFSLGRRGVREDGEGRGGRLGGG
jgi:hypothetical protein